MAKIICGYVWGRNQDPKNLTVVNLELSFNAAVLDDGTGIFFGQNGRTTIENWKESANTLSFIRRFPTGYAVHLLRRIKNRWSGEWQNHLQEHGYIVMWIQEEAESLFTRTIEAVQSKEFEKAFN
jgi:hypothetical protein